MKRETPQEWTWPKVQQVAQNAFGNDEAKSPEINRVKIGSNKISFRNDLATDQMLVSEGSSRATSEKGKAELIESKKKSETIKCLSWLHYVFEGTTVCKCEKTSTTQEKDDRPKAEGATQQYDSSAKSRLELASGTLVQAPWIQRSCQSSQEPSESWRTRSAFYSSVVKDSSKQHSEPWTSRILGMAKFQFGGVLCETKVQNADNHHHHLQVGHHGGVFFEAMSSMNLSLSFFTLSLARFSK